jgi:berberine-like enzyme
VAGGARRFVDLPADRPTVSRHTAIVEELEATRGHHPEPMLPDKRNRAAQERELAGSPPQPAQDAPNIEWARTAWQRMRSFSTGGTYINFLTEEEGEARVRAAYGRNYDRLMAIEQTWDPGNLFRANKNIVPAGNPRGRD